MKQLLITLIHGYRLMISPLLGPRCRFYPTCSQYAISALEIHGLAKGLWLICKRLLRCHPFEDFSKHIGATSGHDPVPLKAPTTIANSAPLQQKTKRA